MESANDDVDQELEELKLDENLDKRKNGFIVKDGYKEDNDSPQNTDSDNDDRRRKDLKATPYPRPGSVSPRGSPRGSPRDGSGSPRHDTHSPSPGRVSPSTAENDVDTSTETPPADSSQEELNMTDDQRRALAEMEELRIQLGYTEEDPPEYNVTERVRQLNKELEQEPTPDDDKERSITFKETLVDLVAPPPDYSTDETEEEERKMADEEEPLTPRQESDYSAQPAAERQRADPTGPGKRNQSDKNLNFREPWSDDSSDIEAEVRANTLQEHHDRDAGDNRFLDEAVDDDLEESRDSHVGGRSGGRDTSASQERQDKILVERNGKFDLVSVKDLTAEERQLYGVASPVPEEDSPRPDGDSPGHVPSPPPEPRPASSVGTRRRQQQDRRAVKSAPVRRPQPSVLDGWEYNSPYALTKDQKEEMRKEQSRKNKEEADAKEQKKKTDKEKEEINDDCFKAWVRKKKDEDAQRRKEENQQRKEEEEKRREEVGTSDDERAHDEAVMEAYREWLLLKRQERQSARVKHDRECRVAKRQQKQQNENRDCDKAFKDWLNAKHAQKKNEKEIEKQRSKEEADAYTIRSDKENKKAFKEWLKQKNKDRREERQIGRAHV